MNRHSYCLGILFVFLISGFRVFAFDCSGVTEKKVTIDQVASRVLKSPRYTQGLVVHGDYLYESTGLKGKSAIYRISPNTEDSTCIHKLPTRYWGEGLAVFGSRLFQLTYTSETIFAYDLSGDPKVPTRMRSPQGKEGWGLTRYKEDLVMSDGSDTLLFLHPLQPEKIRQKVQVRCGGKSVFGLNELENIKDLIFANVYPTTSIVVIHPDTGVIRSIFDVRELKDHAYALLSSKERTTHDGDHVANGIAYDDHSGMVYITGKNWPVVYRIPYTKMLQ